MKSLVIFYSHSGNTRQVAQQIAKITASEWCELLPVHPYPNAYKEVVEQAKQETKQDFCRKFIRSRCRPPPTTLSLLVHLIGGPPWRRR